MASFPTSFFFAVIVVLFCFAPLSSSFVMLETVADITGWTHRTCVYANEYTDMEYAECRVPITGDNERNYGYWSHCGNSACRLTYTVKAGDDPITAIRVRTYLVPNDAVDSPIIRITYKDQNSISKWVEFPVEDGWVALEHEFTLNLGPGSTIEVRQTGYWEGGKDFAMVDRIILSNGLDEPIPTPSTVPPTEWTSTITIPPTTGTTKTPLTSSIAPITTTTFRTTTEGPEIQCPPEGIVFLPDPTNCTKFYICAEGEAYNAECAPGLLFDSKLGKCNIASEVHCEMTPECPNQDGISFLPIVGTCKKYLICVDGEGTELECADGTEFSPEAGKCVLGFEYDCPYTRSFYDLSDPLWFLSTSWHSEDPGWQITIGEMLMHPKKV